jgi:hypothetical protein
MEDLPLPINYFDKQLEKAARDGDPLQFFIKEDAIIKIYEDRIPKFSLSVMMTKRGFDRWNMRKNTLKQIEQSIELHHVQLVNAVLGGWVYATSVQANYFAQELAWTEQSRRAGKELAGQLDIQQQLLNMQAEAERKRDERLHRQAKELLAIKNKHELKVQRLRVPTIDQKLDDIDAYNGRIRSILQDIHDSPEPNRIKNQRATTILNLSTRIFD